VEGVAYVAQHAFKHTENDWNILANEYIFLRSANGNGIRDANFEDREGLKKTARIMTEEDEKHIIFFKKRHTTQTVLQNRQDY
jgi:hypothetical protein